MNKKYSEPQRLDIALVQRGLAKSRTHAQKLIKLKQVSVKVKDAVKIFDKPSTFVGACDEIVVQLSPEDEYVSRAGLKLNAALNYVTTDLTHAIGLDIGQSTGGFTDCLLKMGCDKVVGIEVGHGQLAQSLRSNNAVVCLEGINARHLSDQPLERYAPDKFDIAVMDVSFISQTLILPEIACWLKPKGWLVSLVKPQFEVGKENIKKGGIVKDIRLFDEVQRKITQKASQCSFNIVKYIPSPITGGDGNREFLLIARL